MATIAACRTNTDETRALGVSFIGVQAGGQVTVNPLAESANRLLDRSHYGALVLGTGILPAIHHSHAGGEHRGLLSYCVGGAVECDIANGNPTKDITMNQANAELVTRFCQSLRAADMAASCRYLAPDVYYHNMPWDPVVGHAAVRKVLDPLVHAEHCALRAMEIEHTLADGDVVMNARLETWERHGIRIELPVAGLFVVRGGLITRWIDYWDLATIAPLLATL